MIDIDNKSYLFYFKIHLKNNKNIKVVYASDSMWIDEAIKEMLGNNQFIFVTAIKNYTPLCINTFDIVYIETIKIHK